MSTPAPSKSALRVLVVSSAAEPSGLDATLASLSAVVTRVAHVQDAGDSDVVLVVGGLAELGAAAPALRGTPWVALADPALQERAFELGAADFVGPESTARLRHALLREGNRHRAGAQAQARARLLENTLDSLPFVVFVKDAITGEHVYVNDAGAAAFLGKEPPTDGNVYPRTHFDEFGLVDGEVVAFQRTRTFDETVRTDGVDRLYRTHKVALLDAAGATEYLCSVIEDMTDQRRAELEAQQSRLVTAKTMAAFQQRALQMELIRQQNLELERLAADLAAAKAVAEERTGELEVAVRVRTEFLANFSHEIRTPLNAILGYCDLVLREGGARLTPHGRRDLNVVKQNARTLLDLITNILDLSRIEAGRMDVVAERVDLADVVRECAATVEPLLRAKPVEMNVRIEPNASVLMSDSLKLRQIILNLLSNAAKFTEGGEINTIASIDGTDIVIIIEDTGVGIASAQLEVIFEKFRQVEGGSTRRVGGTGLGLAIVREVCRLLGGTVSVSSVLGRGSRFTVRLPFVAPPRSTPASPSPIRRTTPAPELPRVLYVEDTPQNRDLMRRFLAGRYELFEAEDGEAGVARAKELVPDLILMDLSLPRMDGWEATKHIKADPRLAHVPVIAVSAHSGVDERRRAKEAGCDSYVTKPIDRKLLFETMNALLVPPAPEP